MNPSHWDSIYQGRPQQEPQSARYVEIAEGVKQQISGIDGRLLLLSVSPSLSSISCDITAVDRNAAVVRHRWPGNTPNRRAVVADWLQLPFAEGSFAACVGDGSMNTLEYQDVKSLYDNLARVMLPGGRVVCRVYLTPDIGETVAEAAMAPWQGKARSFVYFKFRLGMAIAAERAQPNVRVKSIYEAFTAYFLDRDRLAAATGWNRSEIDRIDLYKNSSEAYNFPTGQQALSIVPHEFSNARFVPVGTYELAERCPLLVMEKIS
jgi:SAM-dependent methyltransferase